MVDRLFRTDSLVAAWSDSERDTRGAFTEHLYAFAANLNAGQSLEIALESGADSTIDLTVGLAGNDVDVFLARSLENLLADSDSPVQVRAVPDSGFAPPPVLSCGFAIRRIRFSADTPSRQRSLSPTYTASQSLRGLCSALLEQSGASIRVSVRPLTPQGSTHEDLVRSVVGPEELTPSSLADVLASQGELLEAIVSLHCDRKPSPRLLAEIRKLGSSIEVVALADAGYEPLGTRTLAAMFRLPVAHSGAFPGFDVAAAPFVRAPQTVLTDLGDGAVRIGTTSDAAGGAVDAHIPMRDFARHIYVPGQTGAGKSTQLRALACEVADKGHGMLFIDPHGDAARQLIAELPPSRVQDVVFVNAGDLDAPAPINPFAVSDLLQRDTALANVTLMFEELFDPKQQGIVGPRWESWFRMAMLTLIAAQGRRASLLDVPRLFLDSNYLRTQRAAVHDEYLKDFWDKEMAQTNAHTRSEVLGWFTSKFTAFRTNAVLRAALGSGRDALDPTEVMDQGKIIVVSLQKGEIGAPIAQLLGYLYLTRYWGAALKRTNANPFVLFVDEAQTFAKGPLPDILAEGRKFGLYAVVANQYLEQLPDQLQKALLGNVGTVLAFRMGDHDAEQFAGRMGPEFSSQALRRLPNHQAACSLLLNGTIQPAFSVTVDHLSRVAGRDALVMQAQADSILRASNAFFRDLLADEATVQEARSTDDPATMGQGDGAPNASRTDPLVNAIGGRRQTSVPSFLDALKANLASSPEPR